MSLAKTLFELYEGERVLFCKTRHGSADMYSVIQVNESGSVHDLSSDEIDAFRSGLEPVFHESLHSGRSVMREDDGGRRIVIHPVRVFDNIIGFIAVHLKDRSLIDNYIIEGFLKIYHNYITLLYDNQRDRLTGLLNRKTFDDRIMKIIEFKKTREKISEPQNTRRHRIDDSCGFWLGIADIDNFKTINDSYGHLYGDEVLILVSRLMTKAFREDDLLFRYGGEEFVVIIRAKDEGHAFLAFDRFREQVAEYPFPQVGHISISVGMIQVTSQVVPTTFVGHADQALYYAKKHGKNQICIYEKLVEEGALCHDVKFGKVEMW
jgi:diguanylate cyclase (GGDEF)-like protein